MKLVVDLYNFSTKRYVPLMIVLILLILFVVFDGYQIFNLRVMQLEGYKVSMFVAEHWVVSSVLYVLVFAAFVSISAPGAFIMAVMGGFLFGPIVGGVLSVIAATLGALCLYEILYHAVGGDVDRRLSPFAKEIKNGFDDHGFFYMVILRVAPVFPFWVANLVPALLGIKRSVNALTTLIGIAPICFVYAGIGAGAASLLERGHLLDIKKLLTDSAILLPLNGIILLATLPLMVRLWCYYKDQRSSGSSPGKII